VKYAWIKDHAPAFPVLLMCRVLQVSSSGYYGSLGRQPSAQQSRRESLARAATQSHFESDRIYGYRKVHEDLLEINLSCCDETVRRIMRTLGLRSRVKRKFVLTTDSSHDRPIAENRLDRDFTAMAPNEKWVADITYIPTGQGWLYLAAVLDLYSRKIVGWAMRPHIDTALVMSAMQMALSQQFPLRLILQTMR